MMLEVLGVEMFVTLHLTWPSIEAQSFLTARVALCCHLSIQVGVNVQVQAVLADLKLRTI